MWLVCVCVLPDTVDSCGFCVFVVSMRWWTLGKRTSCVQSVCGVLWKASPQWRSNNVITMDSLSYDPSAHIDCALHTHTEANTHRESDEHAQSKSVVLFSWRVTSSILSSTQVMPSQQAPVPSCQVIRPPPPWPLTLRTGRPTPAVCKWRSFGLRMLMRVKHHLPQPTLSFLPLCLKSSTTQAALYFYLSQRAVQSPGGLFLSFPFLFIASTNGILFHFCLPAAGCALGSVLYASHFLCPPPVFYSRMSYITVIHPHHLFFFKLSVPYVLCLWLSLLYSLSMTSFPDLWVPEICVRVLSSQSLCAGLFSKRLCWLCVPSCPSAPPYQISRV